MAAGTSCKAAVLLAAPLGLLNVVLVVFGRDAVTPRVLWTASLPATFRQWRANMRVLRCPKWSGVSRRHEDAGFNSWKRTAAEEGFAKRRPQLRSNGNTYHVEDPKRKLEIFLRHWWPLQPPSNHHPDHLNHPYDVLVANKELCANYTAYWRKLPRFEPSLSLARAQQEPFLKLRTWRTAARLFPDEEQHPPRVQFVTHHKAGTFLQLGLQEWLQRSLPPGCLDVTLFESPMVLSTQWRYVHFVRDPVDLILSGYRYHQFTWGGEMWDWGHNKLQDPQCWECDDADHKVIFDACHKQCTYFELLNRLDETSGVITEAVSARDEITTMVSMMSLLSKRSDALHMSINLFKANPTQACACLLKFLGLEANNNVLASMVENSQTVRDPGHVTKGRYDNKALKAYLRNHPVWAPEFRMIKQLMQAIFQRQAERWGCPEKEAA
mmetsp:Transcript_16006/g.32509  ORF Transcript_16006/g.32509 Transcript_16006/m.32509 type:complete len:438 (-) Transcript_16006:97-1410(-)